MVGLIILAFIIGLGIYYVTTLDFEIGSGISEDKSKAKDVEFTVSDEDSDEDKKIESKKEE